MSPTTTKISIPGNHLMVALLGQRDEHLRIVQDAFPLLRGALPHNVELVVQAGWNLPRIDADSNQLREALLGLVSNAGEAIGDSAG